MDASDQMMDDPATSAFGLQFFPMSVHGLKLLRSGHFACIPTHHHSRPAGPDHLLIWVMAGRGFAQRGQVRVDAGPGSLLALPPGPPHEYGSDPDDPWDIAWIHFDGDAAPDFFERLGAVDRVDLRLGLDAVIRERFLELILAHQAAIGSRQRLCDCLLWGLLGLMEHRLEMLRVGPAPDRFDLVQRVQAHVQEHLAEPLPVEALAEVANLSPRQLIRLFAKLLGTSPRRYVIAQRIARACALLSETSMPVQQVGYACGFDDPYYFSRQFRRTTGQSPTEYRSRWRS